VLEGFPHSLATTCTSEKKTGGKLSPVPQSASKGGTKDTLAGQKKDRRMDKEFNKKKKPQEIWEKKGNGDISVL